MREPMRVHRLTQVMFWIAVVLLAIVAVLDAAIYYLAIMH